MVQARAATRRMFSVAIIGALPFLTMTLCFATDVSAQEYVGPDSDGDGLGDWDEQAIGTRADRVDTDGDGLGDADEVIGWATQPLVYDTDGDGVGDGIEVASGLNPLVNLEAGTVGGPYDPAPEYSPVVDVGSGPYGPAYPIP